MEEQAEISNVEIVQTSSPWPDPSNYKWKKPFTCFEALLTRENIFSTPKVTVSGSTGKNSPVSDEPCLEPTSALATDILLVRGESKHKKENMTKSRTQEVLKRHRILVQ